MDLFVFQFQFLSIVYPSGGASSFCSFSFSRSALFESAVLTMSTVLMNASATINLCGRITHSTEKNTVFLCFSAVVVTGNEPNYTHFERAGRKRRKTKNFPHKTKRTHNFNNNQQRHNTEGTTHPSVIVFFFVGIFFLLQLVHFSRAVHSSKFINFIHSNSTAIHMAVVHMHTTLIRRLPKIQKNYVLRPIDERVRYLYTPYFSGFWRDCTSFWIFYFSHTHTLAHIHSHNTYMRAQYTRIAWLGCRSSV